MKKVNIYWLTSLMCFISFFSSCTDNKQKEIDRLNQQIDSLRQDNAQKDGDIKEVMSFVGVLADGLDSIAKQEDMLFYSNKGREGTIVDREQLRKNLEAFEKTLAFQRERISQLADSLKAKGESLSKLTNLVTYLNQQLDDKDNLIKSLRADLDNKSVNITRLQRKISSLSETNIALNEKVDRQEEALSIQTEIINEGYVKIGTKKELAAMGIISGGFLKKITVNYDGIDKDQFMRVDIRKFTEIPIKSSNPKILTQMPVNSYKIERGKDLSTLFIIDPTAFWKVSNYLIILTK